MRTTDNFLHGFSISFMLAVLCPGALDLVFSCECAGLLKRVALINTIWLAAMSAVSLRYFFALPIFFLAIALLIFALAWLKLPPRFASLAAIVSIY
jgi:hypothetical protein